MTFIWIAIFAYLLFAVNSIIDKFLLRDRQLDHPASYAFAIGLLSGFVVLFLSPFGFQVPSFTLIFLSLLAGAFFTLALLAFFHALKLGEASRVVPVEGGFVPFFTLILAYFLLAERLAPFHLLAFVFLMAGSFLLTWEKQQPSRPEGRKKIWTWAISASFLFALSFTLTKLVYENLGFVNGLIWTRFGMAGGALGLLLSSKARAAIFGQIGRTKQQTGILFLSGQAIGALAGLAQNYAIAKGSVIIVNALSGTQFAFLLMLTTFLSLWYPEILKEKLGRSIIIQKIAAIVLISLGVIILAV